MDLANLFEESKQRNADRRILSIDPKLKLVGKTFKYEGKSIATLNRKDRTVTRLDYYDADYVPLDQYIRSNRVSNKKDVVYFNTRTQRIMKRVPNIGVGKELEKKTSFSSFLKYFKVEKSQKYYNTKTHKTEYLGKTNANKDSKHYIPVVSGFNIVGNNIYSNGLFIGKITKRGKTSAPLQVQRFSVKDYIVPISNKWTVNGSKLYYDGEHIGDIMKTYHMIKIYKTLIEPIEKFIEEYKLDKSTKKFYMKSLNDKRLKKFLINTQLTVKYWPTSQTKRTVDMSTMTTNLKIHVDTTTTKKARQDNQRVFSRYMKAYKKPSMEAIKRFIDKEQRIYEMNIFAQHNYVLDADPVREIVYNVTPVITDDMKAPVHLRNIPAGNDIFDLSELGFGVGKAGVDTGKCAKDLLKACNFSDVRINEFKADDQWTCEDVEKFCEKHRVSCYIIDQNWQFISKYQCSEDRRDHKKKAVMALFAFNHLYQIVDKKIIKSIPQRPGTVVGNDISTHALKLRVGAINKKKKTNELATKIDELKILDPILYIFPEGKSTVSTESYDEKFVDAYDSLENDSTYIVPSGNRDLLKLLCYIIGATKKIPFVQYSGEHISRIVIPEKNINVCFNINMENVLEILKLLDLPFKNQSLGELSMYMCEKHEVPIKRLNSYLNLESRKIFDKIRRSPMSFRDVEIEDVEKEQDIHTIDISKCYTSILRDYDLPVIRIMDYPSEFNANDDIEPTYFYYIKCDRNDFFSPYLGHDWYIGHLTSYMLENGIVGREHILYKQPAHGVNVFKGLIEKLYTDKESTKLAKYLINCLTGCLGKKEMDMTRMKYTTNLLEAKYFEKAKNRNGKMTKQWCPNDVTVWEVKQTEKIVKVSTQEPSYAAILQLGRMKVHQLLSKIQLNGGQILSVKVDAVTYRGSSSIASALNVKSKEKAQIGDYRFDDNPKVIHKGGIEMKNVDYKPTDLTWNVKQLDEWNEDLALELLKNYPDGCFVSGIAGTGKSRMIDAWMKTLPAAQRCAYTNSVVGSRHDGGKTIHRLYGVKVASDDVELRESMMKNIKYLFVDEISMVPGQLYKYLLLHKRLGVKLYLFGDFGQIKPIESPQYDYEDSHILHQLTGGNKLVLNHVYRSDAEFVKAASKHEDITRFLKRNDVELDKINICKFNGTRAKYNSICADKFGAKGEIGSRITPNSSCNKLGTSKNTIYDVIGAHKIKEVFTNDKREIEIPKKMWKEFLAGCDLAYCLTINKLQGATINEQHTIYDWIALENDVKYTSLTRTTNANLIRIDQQLVGCIYMIRKLNDKSDYDKIYIGSSMRGRLLRFAEHQEAARRGKHSNLHRYMREEGIENFESVLLEQLTVKDKNELLEVEDRYIKLYAMDRLLNHRVNFHETEDTLDEETEKNYDFLKYNKNEFDITEVSEALFELSC